MDDTLVPSLASELLFLVGHTDTAKAIDLKTREYVTGIVLYLPGAGITCKSDLQATIPTSSTEAGSISISQDVKAARYLQCVLWDHAIAQRRLSHWYSCAKTQQVAAQAWPESGFLIMRFREILLMMTDTEECSWTDPPTSEYLLGYGPLPSEHDIQVECSYIFYADVMLFTRMGRVYRGRVLLHRKSSAHRRVCVMQIVRDITNRIGN